jgi:hypothetical protein
VVLEGRATAKMDGVDDATESVEVRAGGDELVEGEFRGHVVPVPLDSADRDKSASELEIRNLDERGGWGTDL